MAGDGTTGSNRHLEVKIVCGVLTITIGISTLAFATHMNGEFDAYDGEAGDFLRTTITDEAVFAKEVAHVLNEEEEDGTTLVHLMLDKAAGLAIEQGAEGVLTGDDKLHAIRKARLMAQAS